jgi:hypothetical protein
VFKADEKSLEENVNALKRETEAQLLVWSENKWSRNVTRMQDKSLVKDTYRCRAGIA